jgi:hypothetical protein
VTVPVGKVLMLLGLAVFALGLTLSFAPGLLSWFGKLPGDIRVQEENRFLFVPITSMIVVSIVLTALIHLFFRK